MQEISVEIPAGSLLIEKDYGWVQGIYIKTDNEEKGPSWATEDKDNKKVFIWKGINEGDDEKWDRWNINKNPWTDKDGKYEHNYKLETTKKN